MGIMKLEQGQHVGVKIFDHDKNGKPVTLPPKFFGDVIEAAADGDSGYVEIDGVRTFFHVSELEPAPAKTP